ncbi:MAG: ABC transporter substrate-binding protein, partial [Candidatus Altiarchaeota archaeon]|nr:ABC transporter substrate-binding protein [Candidatus Altiarchaeota archaeon]
MKPKINKKDLSMLITIIAIIAVVIFSGCVGEEKPTEKQGETVTVIDDAGRTVTINTPIESFVYHGHNSYIYETLRAIGVGDRIVGTSDRFVTAGKSRYSEAYFPKLVNFTNVGLLKSPDYEVINVLKPDVVISDEESYYDRDKTPRIPVIAIDVKPTTFKENTMKYGYLFNKEKEAKKYIDWYNKWENEIKNRTEDISDDEKPLVYIGYYDTVEYGSKTFQVPAKDNYRNIMVHTAGGRGMGD